MNTPAATDNRRRVADAMGLPQNILKNQHHPSGGVHLLVLNVVNVVA